ncbi:MAG: tripartite tricarboxylate transporter substrate binding protein [Enterocloster asparagiformis]|nr:tripartite tricarboxylate transporter substrate binding protein [Enterocloster asparagiformis]
MKKRRILILTALLTTALAGCGRESPAGEEKTYPLEAVELIAPAGPGGGYDLTIRAVAQCLQEEGLVDVPLPVTNKPGGGGRLCLEYMHEKQGNDDMLVVYSPPLCLINLNGSTKLNYRDNTTPIAKLAVDYGCFAVKADSPYRTLNDVMSRLKEDPKAVKIGGTSSEYSMDHVQFLKIAHAAGVKDLQLIPYEGFENGGVMAQLMGERVDVMSAGISDVLGLVESGDIRVLAVTAPERLEGDVISQIPTCRELGIDAEFYNWRGIFGPENMPDYAVEYWEETLREMAKTPEWAAACDRYGWTVDYQGREDFVKFLDQVNEEYALLLDEIW